MAMDPVKDGGNWYQYCYGNPLKYWDPLGTSGFKVFGCQISEDGTVEIDKLEFSLEMIRTFLPMVLRETITGKQGNFDIGKDLAAMMGGLSGHVLKFLGEAFIGLGNGFKYWSPYVTSLGLMSTIFGSGPGAGLALVIPGIGTLTSAAMVTGGLALTAIGLTSDVLGTILMSMGTEMSSMGDRKIAENKQTESEENEYRAAINSLSDNNKRHILLEKHAWSRVVTNPDSWDEVSEILNQVLENGSESIYGNTQNIYTKVYNIKGSDVLVKYLRVDGKLTISDAWVITR